MGYKYIIFEGEPHNGIWKAVISNKDTCRKTKTGDIKYILKYKGNLPFPLNKYKSYTALEIRQYIIDNKEFW